MALLQHSREMVLRLDNDKLLISWINDYVFCKRRFCLHAVENIAVSSENTFVANGAVGHLIVDRPAVSKRGDSIRATRMHVHSEELNIFGICDAVDFDYDQNGGFVDFLDGFYRITPVEYKRGKMREEKSFEMQLLAQAMCLEEMYKTQIPEGRIFYIDSKHQKAIHFSEDIRSELHKIIYEMNEVIKGGKMIYPIYTKRCSKCSFYDICAPKKRMVDGYIRTLWEGINASGKEDPL